jgi:ubiquinone/menaquinone biosynthesis C-methylase UbiE
MIREKWFGTDMSRMKICVLAFSITVFSCLFLVSCEGSGRWSEEWEARFETFQPSDSIMQILGIEPGMVVGEIGAGNGRFAVKVAARVGPTGIIYANDIDPEAIRFMERRCRRDRISNMIVIHGKETEPEFPDGALDLVYLINTYDDLSEPVLLLRNTKPSLKPTGRLAVIVYDPTKLKNHQGHAVPRETVINQCSSAGFVLVRMDTSLIYDNIYLFESAR